LVFLGSVGFNAGTITTKAVWPAERKRSTRPSRVHGALRRDGYATATSSTPPTETGRACSGAVLIAGRACSGHHADSVAAVLVPGRAGSTDHARPCPAIVVSGRAGSADYTSQFIGSPNRSLLASPDLPTSTSTITRWRRETAPVHPPARRHGRSVVGHLLAPCARMPGPTPASAAAPPRPAGASVCQRPLRRSGRSVQPGTGWHLWAWSTPRLP